MVEGEGIGRRAYLICWSLACKHGGMSKRLAFAVWMSLWCGGAWAQSSDKDPRAIVEVGGATGWNVNGGAASFGPAVAAEVTPKENWLEIEAGTDALFTRSSTEWDTYVLFKKPWTLSKKAEFMVGAGPEWIHLRQNGVVTNSAAGEVAVDFMYWPRAKHRFGWYVEPAYDYDFGSGHEQSIGMDGGLLIAIP